MELSNLKPVLNDDDIVPFFVNVVYDGWRLVDVVQVQLNQTDPAKIARTLVSDLELTNGFYESIFSAIEAQMQDYFEVAKQKPVTQWALDGSAVHILSIEAGLNTVVYSDMFEWDIFDEKADPDEFALITAKELALPPEFINVISAQIRYQVIRLRCMHCYPDRFTQFTHANPIAAPQILKGLRSIPELIDASPAIGLIPGQTSKNTLSSRDRRARYLKRQGHTVSSGALQPVDDAGILQVKLVPIVRASPVPEDSNTIDLALVPELLGDPTLYKEDIYKKVEHKFNSPILLTSHQNSADDSGSDSGNEL